MVIRVGGVEIFTLFPHLVKEPFKYLDDLRIVADALDYLGCTDLQNHLKLCREICKKFALILDDPKLPAGGAILAAIVEKLSVCFSDKTFFRDIWLKLVKNRKSFIRRRFAKLLQNGLKQREANILWDLYCDNGDSEILRTLILSDPSINLPIKVIEDIAEKEGEAYLLSRAMAHEINASGKAAFVRFRKKYPVSAIYAAGFSGVSSLIPELRYLANKRSVSEDERRGALWALSRLGDKEGVFEIAKSVLK